MIKKIFLAFSFVVLAISAAWAGPEAEYKKLHITYEWNKDGSMSMNYYKELKYNTHSSFNSYYGETFVVYNPRFQNVKVNESYTIQADGKRIDTPANAFNEVLPREATDAPDYNHLKELVITHTGLELGATVYLNYTVTTKAGYYPALDLDIPLQEIASITQAVVTVKVPAGTKYNGKALGNCRMAKTEADGKDVYTYSYSRIPALVSEPLAPVVNPSSPHLYINTYPESAMAYLTNRFDKIAASAAVKKLARELGSKDAIMKYVADELVTVRVSIGNAWDMNRSMDAVLASAYGTPMEKNMLAYVLLSEIGQKPTLNAIYPAAVRRCVGADHLGLVSTTGIDFAPQSDSKPVVVEENKDIVLTAKDAAAAVYVLPASNKGFSALRLTALNTSRTNPVELPYTIREHYDYTLTCEKGVFVDAKPMEKTISNGVGSVEISIVKDGNQVKIHRELVLNKTSIEIAEYKAFRELVNTWLTPAYKTVIVQ